MAVRGIFECTECSNKFPASEGGTMRFEELSCITCDSTESVRRGSDFENITCPDCSSAMVRDLKRMCPLCRSRSTKVIKIEVKMD